MSNCLSNELWAGLDQLDAVRKTVGRPNAILLAQAQEHGRPNSATDQISEQY
jgi:pyridoxine/pyridoxamine 5'-phosphate oxidase